jgi:hypothetical protein
MNVYQLVQVVMNQLIPNAQLYAPTTVIVQILKILYAKQIAMFYHAIMITDIVSLQLSVILINTKMALIA